MKSPTQQTAERSRSEILSEKTGIRVSNCARTCSGAVRDEILKELQSTDFFYGYNRVKIRQSVIQGKLYQLTRTERSSSSSHCITCAQSQVLCYILKPVETQGRGVTHTCRSTEPGPQTGGFGCSGQQVSPFTCSEQQKEKPAWLTVKHPQQPRRHGQAPTGAWRLEARGLGVVGR